MSADSSTLRMQATWYAFLLTGFYLYAVNVQGNVVPFLQAEFALSYRVVSLHSSAIALGVILVGLLGDRVAAALGRRRTLWLAVAGLAGGSILLCVAPPPPFGQLPWASIGACFLMGALGALIPALLPALLADLHGARLAEALAGQAIAAYVFGLAAPLVSGFAIWAGLGWRMAVLFGALSGIAIALWYRKLPIVEGARRQGEDAREARGARGHLPAAFWAYWGLLIASCALEFCILFWAPAFLERVIGFDAAAAATSAAGFPLGMLIGRIALRVLVRRVPLARLLAAALALVFAGFLIYWGVGAEMGFAPAAILGIFVIGLGVAPLYPLVTNFAIGAAPADVPGARDLAAMRMAIAFGTALLLAPIALGALADVAGLGPAHLALPALILAAYACFFAGRLLERRAALLRPA